VLKMNFHLEDSLLEPLPLSFFLAFFLSLLFM